MLTLWASALFACPALKWAFKVAFPEKAADLAEHDETPDATRDPDVADCTECWVEVAPAPPPPRTPEMDALRHRILNWGAQKERQHTKRHERACIRLVQNAKRSATGIFTELHCALPSSRSGKIPPNIKEQHLRNGNIKRLGAHASASGSESKSAANINTSNFDVKYACAQVFVEPAMVPP